MNNAQAQTGSLSGAASLLNTTSPSAVKEAQLLNHINYMVQHIDGLRDVSRRMENLLDRLRGVHPKDEEKVEEGVDGDILINMFSNRNACIENLVSTVSSQLSELEEYI